MLPHPQLYDRPAQAPGRPAAAPIWYSSIPRGIFSDLQDTPLAIGMYALVVRLFLIARAPVPLWTLTTIRNKVSHFKINNEIWEKSQENHSS